MEHTNIIQSTSVISTELFSKLNKITGFTGRALLSKFSLLIERYNGIQSYIDDFEHLPDQYLAYIVGLLESSQMNDDSRKKALIDHASSMPCFFYRAHCPKNGYWNPLNQSFKDFHSNSSNANVFHHYQPHPSPIQVKNWLLNPT